MTDEIPIIDTNNQTKTIQTGQASTAPLDDSTQALTPKEELEKLLEGDVAEESVLAELQQAKEQADSSKEESDDTVYNFKKMSEKLQADTGIVFKDAARKKRLEMLIKSYTNQVRKPNEVKDLILKKIQAGGLGVTEEKADKLLEGIQSIAPSEYKLDRPDGVPTLEQGSVFTTPPEKEYKPKETKQEIEERIQEDKEQAKEVEKKKGFFSKLFGKKRPNKKKDVVNKDVGAQGNAPVATPPEPSLKNVGASASASSEASSDRQGGSEIKHKIKKPSKPTRMQVSKEEQARRGDLGDTLAKLEGEIGKEIDDEISKQLKGKFTPPDHNVDDVEASASAKATADKQKLAPENKKNETSVTTPEPHDLLRPKDAVVPMTSGKKQSNKKNMPDDIKKDVGAQGAAPEASIETKSSSELSTYDKLEAPKAPIIKKAHRLVGPIEELKYSMEDFRRLSPNPEDRVKKIKSKVDLLEDESFSNKYLGIAAWMDSEVIHNYIEIGELCLEQRIPVDTAIANLKQQGKEILLREEFDAVAELNAMLRK